MTPEFTRGEMKKLSQMSEDEAAKSIWAQPLLEDAEAYKAAMIANLERALTAETSLAAARQNFLTMQGAAAQLLKRAESAERVAEEMAKSLTWTIAEIEKRAEYTALGQFDKLLARAKYDRDSINNLRQEPQQ